MVICSRLYTYVNPIDDGICPAAALMGFTYYLGTWYVRVWHRIDEAPGGATAAFAESDARLTGWLALHADSGPASRCTRPP